jgi:hypothetical protein
VSAEAAKEFRAQFTGFYGSIRLWLLRVCVTTSTGEVFRCKPEKELRELVRKIAEGRQPLEDEGSSQRLEGGKP